MRKKLFVTFISSLLFVPFLSGCSNAGDVNISFEKSEYEIHSGDKVTVKQSVSGVTYSFVDLSISDITVDSNSGLITYSNIPNNTQVMYTATLNNKSADPVVLTLLSDIEVPELKFVGISDYICDGNIIYATSSTNSSITYSIKNRVAGVSINITTGQVRFTEAAVEGSEFTVVISSNGATLERTFKVAKTHLVKAINDKQATEIENKAALCFNLDFSESDVSGDHDVLNLITSRHVLGKELFVFDKNKDRLTVKKEAIDYFTVGENILTIVTNKNMINVTVILATKIVKNVEDLVRINDSKENLAGYYVLGNDIDLTDYLSIGGKGYNNGLGWNPIGIYHDVTDGTAFDDTFKGTFDGNGYTISGYTINRHDDLGFNAGLFGYVYNTALIQNLSVTSSGTNKTASFTGAIAGFNEGVIRNCWTDVHVSNDYGGTDHRIIGGFVGRNTGTIESCYALGEVEGETQIGAFVGLNEGTIKNCCATKEGYELFATGNDPIDCQLFDTKADFIAFKNSLALDKDAWDLSGDGYPTIKGKLAFYYPYDLSITNEEFEFIKGDVVDINLKIYPDSLADEFLPKVTLISDDANSPIRDGKLVTSSSSKEIVKVKAVIDDNGLYLEDEKTFYLYSETESVAINNVFFNNKVEPGEVYKLEAMVNPKTANQNVKWSLNPSSISGISIENNEMKVSEKVTKSGVESFELIATSNGVSDKLTLGISIPQYLESPIFVLYENEDKDVTFDLGQGVSLSNAKLMLGSEDVAFTNDNGLIKINKDVIKKYPNQDLGFRLVLADGSLYRLYATYIAHERYAVNNLPNDAIALGSVNDFKQYFNIVSASPTKYQQYYAKTFYLTNDIDFEGMTITSIGYESEKTAEYRSFTGTIYGFGHKIKNAVINDNEKYHTLTSVQKEDKYRDSRYGVGFFGSFSGRAYDILFDNIKVDANSWNGAFAGMVNTGAIVENISFINSKVTNAEGADYSTGGLKTGRFSASMEGKMLGCSFGGSILGLIGE